MAGVDLTTFQYALKTLYPNGIHVEVYKQHPFLAMVQKDTDFYGDFKVVPLLYANMSSRSADISLLIGATPTVIGNSRGVRFLLTRDQDYAVITIDRETMLASSKDAGAIVQALKVEMDSAISSMRQSLSHAIWGNGSGRIGRASTVAAGTVVLTDPNEIVNFTVGMRFRVSVLETGGAPRVGVGLVATIDRDAGSFTYTEPTSFAGLFVATDFIHAEGDYDAKLKGVQAWVPATAPTSTAFFGVDRSVDATRLGGIRFDGSTFNHREALVRAAARMSREQAMPKHAFMHPLDVADLEVLMGNDKVYEDVEGPAGIGFTSIKIAGPAGSINVFADNHCPKGFAYLMKLDTWTLHSLMEAPHIEKDDGNTLERRLSADGFHARLIYYAQLGCEAPGQNCRVTLAT